ncbi:hypothetical protein PR048_000039 [Dryococelus australis]|uniref:Uncharacterized protein n=1 Tax=Dryococelus australis TaxID=614101 RepID=A0ABQ9IDI1_9NEOP|nr:hypothetical protein PR048_000039 [Dryococelus australis]
MTDFSPRYERLCIAATHWLHAATTRGRDRACILSPASYWLRVLQERQSHIKAKVAGWSRRVGSTQMLERIQLANLGHDYLAGGIEVFSSRHKPTLTYYSGPPTRDQHTTRNGAAPECKGEENKIIPIKPSGIVRHDSHVTPPGIHSSSPRWKARRRESFPPSTGRRGGAAVAERLACSPPIRANRVQSLAVSLPDFRNRESYPTIPLVGGFSRGSAVSPTLSFRRCSILTSLHPHRLSASVLTDSTVEPRTTTNERETEPLVYRGLRSLACRSKNVLSLASLFPTVTYEDHALYKTCDVTAVAAGPEVLPASCFVTQVRQGKRHDDVRYKVSKGRPSCRTYCYMSLARHARERYMIAAAVLIIYLLDYSPIIYLLDYSLIVNLLDYILVMNLLDYILVMNLLDYILVMNLLDYSLIMNHLDYSLMVNLHDYSLIMNHLDYRLMVNLLDYILVMNLLDYSLMVNLHDYSLVMNHLDYRLMVNLHDYSLIMNLLDNSLMVNLLDYILVMNLHDYSLIMNHLDYSLMVNLHDYSLVMNLLDYSLMVNLHD